LLVALDYLALLADAGLDKFDRAAVRWPDGSSLKAAARSQAPRPT
jgi:hypothetical protein